MIIKRNCNLKIRSNMEIAKHNYFILSIKWCRYKSDIVDDYLN